MSKNMQNTSYRKLDVDSFDPEQYDENDESESFVYLRRAEIIDFSCAFE